MPAIQVPSSLEQYQISAKDFLLQNPDYQRLVVGAVVFHEDRLLLVQRSDSEKAFPNFWEIPGGKCDEADRTILEGVARELKEETGLEATKIVAKVGELVWEEKSRRTGKDQKWLKLIFEVEVKQINVVLDQIEHQDYLFATEEEVMDGKAGDTKLTYISSLNKAINMDAFRLKRDPAPACKVYVDGEYIIP